jgi:N5-hydroxyornithine acetyltransferase
MRSEWLLLVRVRLTGFRLLNYALDVGFYKEREIAFMHKHANVLKLRRESWQAPVL